MCLRTLMRFNSIRGASKRINSVDHWRDHVVGIVSLSLSLSLFHILSFTLLVESFNYIYNRETAHSHQYSYDNITHKPANLRNRPHNFLICNPVFFVVSDCCILALLLSKHNSASQTHTTTPILINQSNHSFFSSHLSGDVVLLCQWTEKSWKTNSSNCTQNYLQRIEKLSVTQRRF